MVGKESDGKYGQKLGLVHEIEVLRYFLDRSLIQKYFVALIISLKPITIDWILEPTVHPSTVNYKKYLKGFSFHFPLIPLAN